MRIRDNNGHKQFMGMLLYRTKYRMHCISCDRKYFYYIYIIYYYIYIYICYIYILFQRKIIVITISPLVGIYK